MFPRAFLSGRQNKWKWIWSLRNSNSKLSALSKLSKLKMLVFPSSPLPPSSQFDRTRNDPLLGRKYRKSYPRLNFFFFILNRVNNQVTRNVPITLKPIRKIPPFFRILNLATFPEPKPFHRNNRTSRANFPRNWRNFTILPGQGSSIVSRA